MDERKDRQEWIIELGFAESVIVRKTWDGNYTLKERASGEYLGLNLRDDRDELAFGKGGWEAVGQLHPYRSLLIRILWCRS